MTTELEKVLSTACERAKEGRHSVLYIEHLLWALLIESASIVKSLIDCHVELQKILSQLDHYLRQLESVPLEQQWELEQGVGVLRVLQRAAIQAEMRQQTTIACSDVLLGILQEGSDCHACYFLMDQGFSRLTYLRYLSHGTTGLEEAGDMELHQENEGVSGKKTSINDFLICLTDKAKAGKLDRITGRRQEMEQIFTILCRRRKNNPILIGEPGVGKTALAEGLALRIAEGRVPGSLEKAKVYALDFGSVLAGTKFRGEFEARLRDILVYLSQCTFPILFIDEIHTLLGAGAVGHSALDASNLLKPALAAGSLHCLGATTYHEYETIFVKDRALARRFQKVEIKEPSLKQSFRILMGMKSSYEAHHHVTYTKNALKSALHLSHKFIRERFLPDKALDIMDEVGAWYRVHNINKASNALSSVITSGQVRLFAKKHIKMGVLEGRDNRAVSIAALSERLKAEIFGQDESIDLIVSALQKRKAGLSEFERPTGCFLCAGPTGVGKTELAKQLAKVLDIPCLRFDMSEYMEKHSVARLIGAPPGYVGYDQGGLLSDAVSKNPYAVLLLDEIEKAHPDIFNILLQVMDYATLTTSSGKKADFRQIILLLTTNAGSRGFHSPKMGFHEVGVSGHQKTEIERTFSPEFRNRLDGILYFNPLNIKTMEKIVDKGFLQLKKQLQAQKIELHIGDCIRKYFIEVSFKNYLQGARHFRRIVDDKLRKPLAEMIDLNQLGPGNSVYVAVQSVHSEVFDFRVG
jgi:ATP-dependent Clp protease ATP-binding subunit ClpA